jgi:predicted DNA-binding protein (MmcQ/YjbR family)
MVDIETFRQLALSFPETTEEPHFEKTSFRIRKKIFATLSVADLSAVLKLSETDQSVFCSFDRTIIYPANGAWGKQGWTIIDLKKIRKNMLKDALTTAYSEVAPKKLKDRYQKK